jgi:A/G-specific adenine glycosylase
MLQQTRAQTVIPYYQRFLSRFPDVQSLAEARESEVLASWSGLGYYSRARNLQRAAQAIMSQGRFPRDYEGIRELPGVGPYTAAAVASIAFGEPHAVLDGNVVRVISRLTGDGSNIQSPKTRARFQRVADDLLDKGRSGLFNQAMMELGATICSPRDPRCATCPVAEFCKACAAGRQHALPVRGPKPITQRIHLRVAVVTKNGRILLRRRGARERLMSGFWELPAPDDLEDWQAARTLGSFRHTITHHQYTITVMTGSCSKPTRGFRWRQLGRLAEIPLTTIARKAIRFVEPL